MAESVQRLDNANDESGVFGPLHESLVGESTFVRDLNDVIGRLADSNLSVLITGETGTGKDVVARLLHRRSHRNGKPFIKVNCPALPHELLESELFGYEKGVFTGARTAKPGRFELADGGTIFLDEIGDISKSVQIKLTQVLDGERFMRIGGIKPVQTNARVVAATNVSIEEAVKEGRLRKDVCFRLSEYVIHMIPLRDRPEDLPSLAEHFNYNFCKRLEKDYQPISDAVIRELQGQSWPGNVRELAGRVKEFVATGSAAALVQAKTPTREPMRSAANGNGGAPENGHAVAESPVKDEANGREERKFVPLKEAARRAVEETEKRLIEEALRHTLWNRRKAARLLDISYSSLLRRIDAYAIGKS